MAEFSHITSHSWDILETKGDLSAPSVSKNCTLVGERLINRWIFSRQSLSEKEFQWILIFKLTSETLEYHSVAPHISYTMLYHVIPILLPPQPGRALVAALFGTIFLPVSTVAVLARVALIIAYQMALPRQGMNRLFFYIFCLVVWNIVVNSDGFYSG